MMKHWLPSLLGTALVAGVLTAVVLIAPNASSSASSAPSGIARLSDSADADEDANEKADASDEHGRSLGPPSWAHGHGQHGDSGKPIQDKSWKDAWQQLTPAQRSKKMTDLAKAHAEGMRAWADCVAAGKSGVNLAKCEKPLPPGLAKRLP